MDNSLTEKKTFDSKTNATGPYFSRRTSNIIPDSNAYESSPVSLFLENPNNLNNQEFKPLSDIKIQPNPPKLKNLLKVKDKINEMISARKDNKFLKLFLTITATIFILNIILFIAYPEQYYNEKENGVLKSSDGSLRLDGPESGFNRFLDCIYFTTTQLSTVGYGDITPKKFSAKMICSFSHILIIILSFRFVSSLTPLQSLQSIKSKLKNII